MKGKECFSECEHKKQAVAVVTQRVRSQHCLHCHKLMFKWDVKRDKDVDVGVTGDEN
jgi:hypothetical protein